MAFFNCVIASTWDFFPRFLYYSANTSAIAYIALFGITILWTFATALISHKLHNLDHVCKKFLAEVQKRNSASAAGAANAAIDQAHKEVTSTEGVAGEVIDDESNE